ncbi:MAG: hypothetical protein ACI91B_001434 [Planctomycetota bacterium]|jgi:hypothetical protein
MTLTKHPSSSSTSTGLRPRFAVCAVLAFAACGAGSGETGGTENPGGGGGSGGGGGEPGGGDPGGGGGPGGPGGSGNPLAIVLDFSVNNDSSEPRTETVRASVPFPQGGYLPVDLDNMVVSGHQTAWKPLQLWSDGRVKVAQAQFTDEFAAGETKQYTVARDEPALTGAFTRNAWVEEFSSLEFGAEVRDTFQVPYRSFATGGGEVLSTSPLVETRRHRTYHMPVSAPGLGRDYLSSTYYVTEFRDMPFVVVDWVLGNDYLGADNEPSGNTNPNLVALGNADVRGAYFLCKGATECMPYRKDSEEIESAVSMTDGYDGFRVMQDTYLSDAQTRRYRFILRFEPNAASQVDKDRWQETATGLIEKPIFALASQQAWEQTAGAGLLGGPVPGPGDANLRATGAYDSWNNNSWFGTWGRRGDALATATTGTPRNHPLSPELAHAIQGQHHRSLEMLEQMAWAQAMRPYHLWDLEVGAEEQICLWDGTPFLAVAGQHLGRKRLRDNDPYPSYRTLSSGQSRAHGWEHFDHEHWSTDLLFDYWTISGDEWAKEELRNLGQSLKGTMRLIYFYTQNLQAARAEGWCMQGFAQVYQATRDESLKAYAMRRVNEIIEPERHKEHSSRAMTFQANYPGTQYPLNNEFFMPWQHGAVIYGFLGAYRAFDEPLLLEIAEDVVETVEYSWVTNMNHPVMGFVSQGLRYYVPVTHNGAPVPANYWDNLSIGAHFGDSPLGGAHTFLTASLYLLADFTADGAVRSKALQYGSELLGTVQESNRWNKWIYCMPDTYFGQ